MPKEGFNYEDGIIISDNQYYTYSDGSTTGSTWGCTGQTITGLTDSIGYGLINTDIIANWNTIYCTGSTSTSSLNAATGATLNGCTDWGIPTLTEMRAILTGTTGMTQFNWDVSEGPITGWLWTSTQSSADNARMIKAKSTSPFYQDNFIPLKNGGIAAPSSNAMIRYRLIRYF
jgi:hypothetical protein